MSQSPLNSASRLLEVLSKNRQQPTTPQIWLGVQTAEERHRMIHDRQAMWYQFLEDIDGCEKAEGMRDLIVDGTKELTRFFFPDVMNGQISLPSSGETQTLMMAARLLDAEVPIETDELKSVAVELQGILDTVNGLPKVEISGPARKIVAEIINLGLKSINQYQIHGGRGFRDAVKRMLGELAYFQISQTPEQREETTKQSWYAMLTKGIEKVDGLASTALKCQKLLSHIPEVVASIPNMM